MSADVRSGWRGLLSRWGVELFALLAALVAIGFLRLRGLQFGWSTLSWIARSELPVFPFLLLIGVGFQIVFALGRREPVAPLERVRDYLRAIASWRWLAGWAAVALANFLFIYAYVWLKVAVPMLRSALYDPELWRLDRWLHFGVSPSILMIQLVGASPLAGPLDRWYAFWVTSVGLFVAAALADANHSRRRNFGLAFGLIGTLHAWTYLLSPALGPCFASPDLLGPIRDSMPKAIQMQGALWQSYARIVASRGGMLESFSPLFGVAAMPSLHVGMHWLFALWAKRHARAVYAVAVAATFLTFVGSLATGWHYAVDGYVGMLFAWLAVRVADRWVPVAADAASSAHAEAAAEGPAEPAAGAGPPAKPGATISASHGQEA